MFAFEPRLVCESVDRSVHANCYTEQPHRASWRALRDVSEGSITSLPGSFSAATRPGSCPATSNYWEYGIGSRRTMHRKVEADLAKVAQYLRTGLALYGNVVVFEETDHDFPAAWEADADPVTGVRTRVFRRWR